MTEFQLNELSFNHDVTYLITSVRKMKYTMPNSVKYWLCSQHWAMKYKWRFKLDEINLSVCINQTDSAECTFNNLSWEITSKHMLINVHTLPLLWIKNHKGERKRDSHRKMSTISSMSVLSFLTWSRLATVTIGTYWSLSIWEMRYMSLARFSLRDKEEEAGVLLATQLRCVRVKFNLYLLGYSRTHWSGYRQQSHTCRPSHLTNFVQVARLGLLLLCNSRILPSTAVAHLADLFMQLWAEWVRQRKRSVAVSLSLNIFSSVLVSGHCHYGFLWS